MENILDFVNDQEPVSFFIIDENGASKPAFEIDGILNSTTTMSSTSTAHPRQNETDSTDHVKNNPITLSMAFLVTNSAFSVQDYVSTSAIGMAGSLSSSPLAGIGTVGALTVMNKLLEGDVKLRNKKVYEMMEDVWRSKTPLQIYTKMREYQNMSIESISITETKDTQQSLHGTINFKEVHIVDLVKVQLPPTPKKDVEATAKSKTNKGKDQVKGVEDKTQDDARKKSVYLSIID